MWKAGGLQFWCLPWLLKPATLAPRGALSGHLLLGVALLLGGILLGIGAGRAMRSVKGPQSRQTSLPRGLAWITPRGAHACAHVLQVPIVVDAVRGDALLRELSRLEVFQPVLFRVQVEVTGAS